MMKIFLLSLALVLTVNATAADSAICATLVKTLSSSRDTGLMSECMNYLFYHDNEDAPSSSYNNIIAIGYRLIDVDPQSEPTYINVAWLLYSKWVMWKWHPDVMPDGGLKMREGLQLLQKGDVVFAKNANYFQDAGNLLYPAAWYEDASLTSTAERYFMQADQLTTTAAVHVRMRLDLGHLFRHAQDKPSALLWYHKVLEIDPQNAVALKYIKELQ